MPLYKKISKYFVATILMTFVVAGFIFVLPSLGIVNQPSADGLKDANFFTGEYKGIAGASRYINASVVLSNGKILIGGSFSSYNGTPVNNLARLNSDGTLDTTFNPSGMGPDGTVYAIAVLSDGKILVGGYFSNYNGVSIKKFIKLNEDGTIDTSFNSGGTGANNDVNVIKVLSTGKILIGGYLTSYNGNVKQYIVRLNADGSFDSSFNSGGAGPNNKVFAIAEEANGNILIGGTFSQYNGEPFYSFIRLDSNGNINTVSSLNLYQADVEQIKVLANGKIYIAGSTSSGAFGLIRRLNSDLSVDTGFVYGSGPSSEVRSILVQSDGKIIMVGGFSTYKGISVKNIVRLTDIGDIDNTFNTGTGTNSTMASVSLQPDGKIVIGGSCDTYNGAVINGITRLESDGTIDPVWGYSTGLSGNVLASDSQADGKIVMVGDFKYFNQSSRTRIVRVNTDGTLDTTFSPGSGALSSSVYVVKVQPDQKILIGGLFTFYNGTSRNRIARINADGTLDTSFTPGTGATVGVYSIQLQSSEKILIGGAFTTYNGTGINRIARLNMDGTLDTSFTPGTGADGTVSVIQVLSDGKILIGGAFTNYNGTGTNRIARLNMDGTLDTSFTPGTGADGAINTMQVLSDGKIIIGGAFTNYNGTNINRIALLNSDGTLDTSFVPGTGANGNVNAIQIQSDGGILIGGAFTTYNGTSRNRVARVNVDGTLDTVFMPGTGASDIVNTLLLQTGVVYVGGNFAFFNNAPASFFVRLGLADLIAPTGSIIIAEDVSTTSTKSVGLSLAAQDNQSGVSEMMICNDISFTGCAWESFSSSKAWTLEGDSGTKTVYVKFKDGSGVVSSIYSDSIVLALPVVEEDVVTPPAQNTGTTHTYSPTTQEPVVTSPNNDVDEESEVQPAEIKILNENGTPIVGARVEIDGKAYITDSKGVIVIANFNAVRKYIAKVTYNGRAYSEEILGIEGSEKRVIIDTVEEVKDENVVEEVVNEKIPWYYYVGSSVLLSVVLVLVLRKRNRVVNQDELITKDIQ